MEDYIKVFKLEGVFVKVSDTESWVDTKENVVKLRIEVVVEAAKADAKAAAESILYSNGWAKVNSKGLQNKVKYEKILKFGVEINQFDMHM